MNKKIIQTIRSLAKSLLLSLTLHLACGVTSYALWHAMKAIPLSSNKLKKGEFLTASVEFVALPSTHSDPISASASKITIAQQKSHLIGRQKTRTQNIAMHRHPHTGSTLPDIIPSPENKHPMYPEEARLTGKEALCIMKISVAPNGTIHQVVLENDSKSCPAVFMREAKKTISTWQFSPHRSGYIERTVPIKFKLD
jgi:TonB family protein